MLQSASKEPARPWQKYEPGPNRIESLDNLIFPIFFLTPSFNMLNYLEIKFVMKFT